VASAAAPDASLRFLFYGGILVLPVVVADTIGGYWAFRWKSDEEYAGTPPTGSASGASAVHHRHRCPR
jgi:cytochrome bd-type quinol oxidase subunit 2